MSANDRSIIIPNSKCKSYECLTACSSEVLLNFNYVPGIWKNPQLYGIFLQFKVFTFTHSTGFIAEKTSERKKFLMFFKDCLPVYVKL